MQVNKVKAEQLPKMMGAFVQAAGLHKFKKEASKGEYAHLVKRAVIKHK